MSAYRETIVKLGCGNECGAKRGLFFELGPAPVLGGVDTTGVNFTVIDRSFVQLEGEGDPRQIAAQFNQISVDCEQGAKCPADRIKEVAEALINHANATT